MEKAVVLGLLQGTFEWLPVSSQGIIVVVHSLLFDGEIAEGIGYSLWLHIGTVPSVLVAFRKETAQIVGEVLSRPLRPSPLAAFLLVSTVVSGIVWAAAGPLPDRPLRKRRLRRDGHRRALPFCSPELSRSSGAVLALVTATIWK